MNDDTTELTVLKHLAMRRRIQFTAAACDIFPKDVRAIADAHGALLDNGEVDYVAAGHAATELQQRIAGTVPERAPDAGRFPHGRPAYADVSRPAPRPVAGSPAPRPAPAPSTPATEPAQRRQNPSPAGGTPRASSDDQLLRVPIDQVLPDPDNAREDVGDVTELAESLRVAGMLQPIVVRRTSAGTLVVVAGHRRLAAARLAGWSSLQVIVRRDMRPDDVLAAMLVENSHRKDLDPIEEARGLARLKAQLGATDAAVGRRVGRNGEHVTARLMLLLLPVEEQEELRRGEMTLTEAKDRAKLASGRGLGNTGSRGMPHLSSAHPLGEHARARCRRLGHSRGRGQGVGGLACGACWESVIRADERQHLHTHSARTGTCVICTSPIDTTPTPLREASAS